MSAVRTTPIGALLLLAIVACEERSVVRVEVASVEITPESFTLVEGESRAASATPYGSGGEALSGRAVTWTTDAPAVATVDGDGTLHAVGAGETTLHATVEGVSASAPVSVLPGPAVELSRSEVTLAATSGGASGTEVVQVTNGGNGVLSGLSASVDYPSGGASGWLTAGLGGTTAPTDLSLRASAATLGAGSHAATVTVSSNAVTAGTAVVSVQLDVSPPPPAIVLESEEVSFSAVAGGLEPAVLELSVTNGGGGVLGGLATSIDYLGGSTGWLTAALADVQAPTVLRLEASATGLAEGTYRAEVEVLSDQAANSPRTVAVEFVVAGTGP